MALRAQFQRMCARIGVDPLARELYTMSFHIKSCKAKKKAAVRDK